jgi:putative Mn2+ efflux pump MntP
MNLLDVILIGVALSMDAVAITISNCITYKKTLTPFKQWSMPVAFALFQGIMPLIGFFVGSTFAGYLQNYAGYLVSVVFFILAGKIFFDIYKDKKCDQTSCECQVAKFSIGTLIIQAIATSIDALIVGVTLSLSLSFSIVWAVIAIALTTFVLVTVALLLGKLLGKALGSYAEWVGAGILLIIAVKNLIEAILQ